MRKRVAVLGAGIQGVSVALALRDRYDVTVIDAAPNCLQRASLRNEGKLHLGMLFANDPSLRTARLMQRGAFSFGRLLETWLQTTIPWSQFITPEFAYCLGATSMLSAETIVEYYEQLDDVFRDNLRDPAASYMGERPKRLWEPLCDDDIPQLARSYARPFARCAERALDRGGFSSWIGERFNALDDIERCYRVTIEQVDRTRNGFCVRGTDADGAPWKTDADLVVNCLWHGRLAIDATLGIAPRQAFVHRLKYRVFVQLPRHLEGLPPMTFTFGPYGDIVTFPDGLTYLSYYPLAIQGWSNDIAPPTAWNDALAGEPDPAFANALARQVIATLDGVLPGLSGCKPLRVDAGAIFTWGNTDIDQLDSQLHERHDVGIEEHDGYFTIDTGRYTTAPLFADELERML